jgi:hypothetical protein
MVFLLDSLEAMRATVDLAPQVAQVAQVAQRV